MHLGKDHYIYKVPGNGACAANCIALVLFGDDICGPIVRRQINKFRFEVKNFKLNAFVDVILCR